MKPAWLPGVPRPWFQVTKNSEPERLKVAVDGGEATDEHTETDEVTADFGPEPTTVEARGAEPLYQPARSPG